MKKIIIIQIIFLSLIGSVYSQSGWYQLSSGTTHFLTSSYFLNVNTGIVVGDSGIVLKTNNGGINWNIQTINTSYHFNSIYFTDLNTAYICGDSGYTNGIILKTIDSGMNWVQIYKYPQSILMSVYFNNPNTGFAGGYNGTILKTTNAGTTWSQLNSGTIFPILSIHSQNINTSYAVGGLWEFEGLIFKTTNQGLNWINQFITDNPINTVSFVNDLTGFAGGGHFETGAKIFKTSNGGDSWFEPNPPIQFGVIRSIVFTSPDTGYCVGYNFTNISKTTNGGANWVTQYTGLNSFPNNLFMLNSLTGYAIGSNGLILKTTNGGNPPFFFGIIDTNTLTPLFYWSRVAGATSYRLQISLDTLYSPIFDHYNILDTFYRMSPGLSWGSYYARLQERSSNDSTWVGVLHFHLYPPPTYTVSGTVRYQDNNQTLNHGYVKALKLDRGTMQIRTIDSTNIQSNGTYSLIHMPHDSTFIMAYADDENDFVPTYHDSTIYWQNASIVYPNSNMTNVDVKVYRINKTPGQMHIGGSVFTSSFSITGLQNAITYAKVGNQFKAFSISGPTGSYKDDSLAQNNYTIICDRIGYNGGTRNVTLSSNNQDTVNFYLISIIGIDPLGSPIPTSYRLEQNYPNPFNPSTTIKFSLPKTSHVQLVIYDLLGREVTKLADEQLNAGSYKVDWNASNYASGLYFYKLTATAVAGSSTGDFVETKKLVFLK